MGSGASMNSLQKQVTHLNISKNMIAKVRDDCLALSEKGLSDEEIQHMLQTSYSNIIDDSGNIIETLFAEISVGRLKDVESRSRCRQSCITLYEKGLDDGEVLVILKIQFKNLVDTRYNIIEKIQTEVKCRQECIKLFKQGIDEDEILNTLKIEYQESVGSMEKISSIFSEIQNVRTKENTEASATDYGSSGRSSNIEKEPIGERSLNASSDLVLSGISALNCSTHSTETSFGPIGPIKQNSKMALIKQPSKMGMILERQTSMLRPIVEKALSIIRPIEEQLKKLPTRKDLFQGVVAKINTQNDSEVTKKKSSGIRRGSMTDAKKSNYKKGSMNELEGPKSVSHPRRRRNSMDSETRVKKVYEVDEDITYFKGSFLNSQQGPLG